MGARLVSLRVWYHPPNELPSHMATKEAAEDYAPLSLAARPSPPETSDAAPVPVCSNSPVPEQVAEPSDEEEPRAAVAILG